MQSEQLIRVERASRTPSGIEQSYRLLIDELPQPGEAPTNGVSIRLRYSIPVFVGSAANGAPQLDWALLRSNGGWVLRVRNGGARAQLVSVELVTGDGHAYPLTRGLLGYALAGRTGQWSVPLPAGVTLGGKVTVRAAVNSQPASAVVRWSRRARPPVRRPASPLRHAPAGSPPTDAKRRAARRAPRLRPSWPAACS